MRLPSEWQFVQELEFALFAIAVSTELLVNNTTACGRETSPGENAFAYQNAAITEMALIKIVPQIKTDMGHAFRRSLVGDQLNCALPGRIGRRGCKGDGRAALSRVRLSQNSLRASATCGDAGAKSATTGFSGLSSTTSTIAAAS